jgi:hypothetical protein
MAEIKQSQSAPVETTSGTSDIDADVPSDPGNARARADGLIAWCLISIGLLAYIGFGSVDARIWRFNNLRIESRSVLRVWTLQAETLPTVSQQWLLSSLFYACIILFIACALIGLWFLLDSAGTGNSRTEPNLEPDQDLP